VDSAWAFIESWAVTPNLVSPQQACGWRDLTGIGDLECQFLILTSVSLLVQVPIVSDRSQWRVYHVEGEEEEEHGEWLDDPEMTVECLGIDTSVYVT
jgi:hypothetical protein